MRPSKSIPDPNTGKRTLRSAGIGYHQPTNRYRIRFKQRDKTISEHFPVTAAGLAAARRRADLDRQPLLPALADTDLGPELVLIDGDRLGSAFQLVRQRASSESVALRSAPAVRRA
jgi:hypothetical protein